MKPVKKQAAHPLSVNCGCSRLLAHSARIAFLCTQTAIPVFYRDDWLRVGRSVGRSSPYLFFLTDILRQPSVLKTRQRIIEFQKLFRGRIFSRRRLMKLPTERALHAHKYRPRFGFSAFNCV